MEEEDQFMGAVDVTRSAASPEIDPQVVFSFRNVREAVYFLCSDHDACFRALLKGPQSTHGNSSSDSVT